jgi:hydrogenase maturation protease
MTRRGDPGQRTVVVGVGNEFRRDDGAGPAVIARLRALQPGDASLSGVTLALSDGEPGRMIDLWEGARLAVVIDAVRDSRLPPGHRYQLAAGPLAGAADGTASSHGISLGDTVELARVLGRLPARLTVLAVVGRDFSFGTEMTAEVAAAVAELVEQVREIVRLPDHGRDPGHASHHHPLGKRILRSLQNGPWFHQSVRPSPLGAVSGAQRAARGCSPPGHRRRWCQPSSRGGGY